MYLYVIIITIIGFCVILGIKRGLVLELISLCSAFICIILTFTFFESLARFVDKFFIGFLGKYAGNISSSAISFAALCVLFSILSLFLNNKIFGKLEIKLLYLIDKLGSMILGAIRGFVIASLVLIILFMFSIGSSTFKNEKNYDIERKIYLIAPRLYEYLAEAQSSDSSFDSGIFLNTYGNFLSKEN